VAGDGSADEPGVRDTGVFRPVTTPADYSLRSLHAGEAREIRSPEPEYGQPPQESGTRYPDSTRYLAELCSATRRAAREAEAEAGEHAAGVMLAAQEFAQSGNDKAMAELLERAGRQGKRLAALWEAGEAPSQRGTGRPRPDNGPAHDPEAIHGMGQEGGTRRGSARKARAELRHPTRYEGQRHPQIKSYSRPQKVGREWRHT
jgi:hypothetical protein